MPKAERSALSPDYELGTLLPTKFRGDDKYYKAEILSKGTRADGFTEYYVHYVDFNKRLDDWVTVDKFDPDATPDTSKIAENKKKQEKSANERRSRKRGTKQPEDELVEEDHVMNPFRVRNITKVNMGRYAVDSWYYSPYPPEAISRDHATYLCEFCFAYNSSLYQLQRHMKRCKLRHPPGDEIYRDQTVSFFEVDGCRQRVYCQNLSLLAKLFLDHKNLHYDVEPFVYYVMCECTDRGYEILGFFSKEKKSEDDLNLACICTLPQHQGKGFGRTLIQFSYELSKLENRRGSPETPLSDLGLLSYQSYWLEMVIDILKDSESATLESLCQQTSIKVVDMVNTLTAANALRYSGGKPAFTLTEQLIKEHEAKKKKIRHNIDPTKIKWVPISDWHHGRFDLECDRKS